MKYRTKPFEIDAIQYTGDNVNEILEGFDHAVALDITGNVTFPESVSVWDYLQETWVKVNLDDYIICGMKGEFYPCEKEVFEAKYEDASIDRDSW